LNGAICWPVQVLCTNGLYFLDDPSYTLSSQLSGIHASRILMQPKKIYHFYNVHKQSCYVHMPCTGSTSCH
jgi:hypothetical protein